MNKSITLSSLFLLFFTISSSQSYTSLKEALQNPNKVETLILRDKGYKILPKAIFKLKNLKVLEIRNSEITHIPKDFKKLKKLRKLSFINCPIATISPNLSKLKQLEELSFSKPTFVTIPDCIFDLTNLKKLSISYGKFQTISKKIENLKKLESVSFSSEELTSLPNSMSKLVNLKTIWINITADTIPLVLFKIPNLVEMHLEWAKCRFFPSQIPLNKSLKSINLEHSQIEELSDIFGQLPNLVTFDVAWCRKISNIPPSFFNLKQLEFIFFIQCNISEEQKNQAIDVFKDVKKIRFEP